MKRKKIAVVLVVLLVTVLLQGLAHANIQKSISRGPASISSSCKGLIQPFIVRMQKGVKIYPQGITSTLTVEKRNILIRFLQNLSYYSRMGYLRFLSMWGGQSELFSKKLAEVLNESIRKGVIDFEDAKSIVLKMNRKGNRQLVIGAKGFVGLRMLSDANIQKTIDGYIDNLFNRLPVWNVAEQRYREIFKNLESFPDDAKVFFSSLKKLPQDDNGIRLVESYIAYCKSFDHLNRKRAYSDVRYLFAAPKHHKKSKHVQKFYKMTKKFDAYERKIEKQMFRKTSRMHAPKKAKELAAKKARHQREIYEKLTYGCRAKKMTPEHRMAARRFKQFYITIGFGATIGTYSYNNWDKEKDAKWFGNLGYDIVVQTALRWLSAKIQSNPHSPYLEKIFQSYTMNSVVDSGMAVTYSYLFGVSDEASQERYDKLKQDPNFDENIQKLIKFLEKEEFDKKFVKTLGGYLIKEDSEQGEILRREIKKDDLGDDEIKALILKAIARQIYQEGQGEWIRTGNRGMDRYVWNRLYTPYTTASSIAIGYLMYNTLCMGMNNPAVAVLKSLAIYTTHKVVSDSIGYYIRRRAINQ